MLKERIISSTLINIIGKFFNFLIQFLIITYLVKSIGKELYGLVVLILSLIGVTNILESGFGLSITKYVAELKKKEDIDNITKLINVNFLIITIFGIIYCIILIFLNLYIELVFKIPSQYVVSVKRFVFVVLPVVMLELWDVSFVRILEGLQKFKSARICENAKWLLRFLFIILFIKLGFSLLGVAFAYFFSVFFTFLLAFYLTKRALPFWKLKFNNFDITSTKLIFGFSFWVFLAKFFSFISYKIDIFLIGIFLSPVNLSYYNIAYKIFEFLRYGQSLLTSTLVPVSSQLSIELKDRITPLFLKATRYIITLNFPILVFAYFYVDRILYLFFGNSFSVSVTLCRLFILCLFFTGFVIAGTEIMIGLNRLKNLIPIVIASSIFNFILSLILIHSIGVHGVVLGTFIANVLLTLGYLSNMIKFFKLNILDYLKYIFKKNNILLILLAALFQISQKNIIIGFFLLIITFFLIFFIIIEKSDKKLIYKIIKLKMIGI